MDKEYIFGDGGSFHSEETSSSNRKKKWSKGEAIH
jgi:hypothetical protein